MSAPIAEGPMTKQLKAENAPFRHRLQGGASLFGTLIKIPTTHSTEIIGSVGFDFVIIDQEHSNFDRPSIEAALLAARATGIAALVRVPDVGDILSALDSGATGVLVPHVDSAEKARKIAAACRYRNGARGYAATTRAGRYGGAKMAEHVEAQDSSVVCIAMIEDAAALKEIDSIAAVAGIHALFIGRSDLSVSLGVPSATAPEAQKAVEKIFTAARAAGIPVMALPTSTADGEAMKKLGATAFVISNDQNFIKKAAEQALEEFTKLLT